MPYWPCYYFRTSKYPGRRISVPGVDGVDVQSTHAIWNACHRDYRWLVIDYTQTQQREMNIEVSIPGIIVNYKEIVKWI